MSTALPHGKLRFRFTMLKLLDHLVYNKRNSMACSTRSFIPCGYLVMVVRLAGEVDVARGGLTRAV